MLRRTVWLFLLFLALAMAVLFAAMNPGAIDVDLGLAEFHVQKSVALTLAFASGWLFGILCLAVALLRVVIERRRLREALRLAEAEVHTLRSQPASHAD